MVLVCLQFTQLLLSFKSTSIAFRVPICLSVCLSVCMLAYLRNYIISRLYQIVNDLALDVQFAWADSCSVVLVVA